MSDFDVSLNTTQAIAEEHQTLSTFILPAIPRQDQSHRIAIRSVYSPHVVMHTQEGRFYAR